MIPAGSGAYERRVPLGVGADRMLSRSWASLHTVAQTWVGATFQLPTATFNPAAASGRFAFINHAQALGASLDESRSLRDVEDGRSRLVVQSVTQARLDQIEVKPARPNRMRESCRCRVVRRRPARA